jgi:hypothetical protein
MAHKQHRSTVELMGLYEIAQVAGVTPQAVSNWVARKLTFPKPLAVLASGAVWDGGVIRAWLTAQQLGPEGTGDRRVFEQFVAGDLPPLALPIRSS